MTHQPDPPVTPPPDMPPLDPPPADLPPADLPPDTPPDIPPADLPPTDPPPLHAGGDASTAAERALAEAQARRAGAQPLPLAPELGGRDGPEPVRYGDWERKGIAVDF